MYVICNVCVCVCGAWPFNAGASSIKEKLLRTEFSPLMFFGSLTAREVVVVEVPWNKAMKKLPLPFNRSRYGT